MTRHTLVRATTLAVLAALVATTTGCAAFYQEKPVAVEQLWETRDDARTRLQDVAAALQADGLSPVHGTGQWDGCNDYGGAFSYEALAQLDMGEQRPADAFDAAVESITEVTGHPGVLQQYGTRNDARFDWGDVRVVLHVYDHGDDDPDLPSVVVRVQGECLPFRDKIALENGDRGAQDLDIGAPADQ